MYSKLKGILAEIEVIPERDWNTFLSVLSSIHLPKNNFILREGQACRGIYFISSGAVRTYCLQEGKEVNTSFAFESEFVHELESLSTGKPSTKFIQTMEDTEIVFIDKLKLTRLYDNSTSFQTLGRKILERIAVTEQKYSSLFTIYSPKERYLHLLKNHPELIQRVPLQYLASYLGVARETLSRIRKRLM